MARKLLLSSFSWLWQRPFYSRVNGRDLDATLNLQECLRDPPEGPDNVTKHEAQLRYNRI